MRFSGKSEKTVKAACPPQLEKAKVEINRQKQKPQVKVQKV
jgi:hypothetical protein